MAQYEFEDYFDFGDYVFENKKVQKSFPVLCRVSNQNEAPGGLCRYSAVIDACQTQKTIYEAMRDPKRANYFGNFFGEELAEHQLINTGYGDMLELFDHVKEKGLTSKKRYLEKEGEIGALPARSWRIEEDIVSHFYGEPRYSVDGIKVFPEVHSTVEEIKRNDPRRDPDIPTSHIKELGPGVGVFTVDTNYNQMCQVGLYVPDPLKPVPDAKGEPLAHAVLLTGYGIATNTESRIEVPYYNFQNNWGDVNKYRGRLPCEACSCVYVPWKAKPCTIPEFIARGGSSSIRLVKKDVDMGI